jgi:hypothetical protein
MRPTSAYISTPKRLMNHHLINSQYLQLNLPSTLINNNNNYDYSIDTFINKPINGSLGGGFYSKNDRITLNEESKDNLT